MKKKRTIAVVAFLASALAAGAQVEFGVTTWAGYALDALGGSLASASVSSTTLARWIPAGAAIRLQVSPVSVELGVGTDQLVHATQTQTIAGTTTTIVDADGGSRWFLVTGVALGLPIRLGGLVLTPRLGIEGDFVVAAFDAVGNAILAGMTDVQRSDLNEGWITAGTSLTVPLSRGLWVQPWFQIAYKLPSPGEATVAANLTSAGFQAFLLGARATAGAAIGLSY
jgi:hypothetical protein